MQLNSFINEFAEKFQNIFSDHRLKIHYILSSNTLFFVVNNKELLSNDNFIDFQVCAHETIRDANLGVYLCVVGSDNFLNLDQSSIVETPILKQELLFDSPKHSFASQLDNFTDNFIKQFQSLFINYTLQYQYKEVSQTLFFVVNSEELIETNKFWDFVETMENELKTYNIDVNLCVLGPEYFVNLDKLEYKAKEITYSDSISFEPYQTVDILYESDTEILPQSIYSKFAA
jgi:hypothetical protein